MRSPLHPGLLLLAAVGLSACGAGGGSPVGPPPVVPTHSVVVTVFYDENGNGTLDVTENGRVPGVEVEVAGRTGRTDKATGRATVAGVPEGSHRVSAREATLPAFYHPTASANASVQSPQPAGADVYVPLTLAIGRNRPNVYMGFGDSITVGDGARTTDGYRDVLEQLLREHFGRAQVISDGIGATRTDDGVDRIGASLNRHRPAYTLILYGTNDWNRASFECRTTFACDTAENLRHMIGAVESVESLPVVATIPPANPNHAFTADRNVWIGKMNDLIRPMARAEGAVVADVHAAFLREANVPGLFADHVHPNDRGYQVIAAEFFRAITAPPSASRAAPPSLFTRP
ncbi:MAG TPA: SGNH/GDSL hydrolase family protein [Vicinamibacteria bacterium]|nr:SGNH/GDSL hydrolase family protein [Vicinamibacteria bacterium]